MREPSVRPSFGQRRPPVALSWSVNRNVPCQRCPSSCFPRRLSRTSWRLPL